MTRIDKILELLNESPSDSFLQHALALEYIKIDREGDAKKLFEAILGREPGYVGTYYHLAKLLERTGDTAAAINVYEAGMAEAKKQDDNKALGELRGAYEELIY